MTDTTTVPPAELRPGDVLCGDDGKPFAFITVLEQRDDLAPGLIQADTIDWNGWGPFPCVSFPADGPDVVIFAARITPDLAGTWLDGRRGWHNAYRVVDRAEEYGFVVPDEYADALRRYREEDYDGLTDDERYDVNGAIVDQGGLSDKATEYLDLRAPAGYEFHWDAGELSLVESWMRCASDGGGCTEEQRCPEHCDCGEC